MNTSHTIARLGDIASIRQGHPFRGAIRAAVDGSVRIIQLKNVSVNGVDDAHDLLRTHLSNRKAPDWVKDGDVVLTARGKHPMAALLIDPPETTVCSPHLYVIRVADAAKAFPAFIAWQLNQSPAQEYLRRQSAGSRQQSLRKASVEDLQMRLPPLLQQQRIVTIARAALLERSHCEQLIAARTEEVSRYAEHLLDGICT
ncbi:restriction endonuclease subunit S [Stenotrophomonas bentonitica]|uniref:restriction endonuclease subunit S n=1 Tax=Stenotrophomonas bentonitica TaxID=1450134 RepID=UPI00345E3D36